jgi:hypothetical protein
MAGDDMLMIPIAKSSRRSIGAFSVDDLIDRQRLLGYHPSAGDIRRPHR